MAGYSILGSSREIEIDLPILWLCRGRALCCNWWTASALDIVHPQICINIHPDAVPPIHAESYHVATDKGPLQVPVYF